MFYCRLGKVKGHMKSKIYELGGNIVLGKPLEPNEVRVINHVDYADIYSKNADKLQAYIDEKTGMPLNGDIRQNKPLATVQATTPRKPSREALLRLAALIRANP